MGKLSRTGPGPRRGALAGLAIFAVTGLAACGTAIAGKGAAPAAGSPASPAGISRAAGLQGAAGVALCAARDRVDTVVVTLIPGLAASRGAAAQPAGVTITDKARVRALAKALCGLPASPRGVVNCPADFGGAYRMDFRVAGRRFPAVAAQASGCRTVTGVGPVRTAGEAFWPVLASALDGRLPGANPGGPSQP